MADVTISQFADVLKVPVDRLIAQLDQAGITVSSPDDMISEDAKLELLTHLRRSHGSGSEGSAPNRITLKRKTQSELKLASNQGRARTVNVEVRQKRTYIKRDVLEGHRDAGPLMMEARILRPLVWFGLLETRVEATHGLDQTAQHFYRKTPLFDRFLSFDVRIEPPTAVIH